MRSVLVLAAALLLAVVRAQDVTPLVTDADEITPLVTPTDDITPLVPTATTGNAADVAVTTTLCASASATVTVGVDGVDIDPYNPPEGWSCELTWPQGGGVWTMGIAPQPKTSSGTNIVKIVVPVVVSVVAALLFLGIGLFAVRRRAQRAHKNAAARPWFTRQGWVAGSQTNVVEVAKPVPATRPAESV